MDDTSDSSFYLNESDLRLSTSLCQWAGFELDCESQITTSEDYSGDLAMTKTNAMLDERGISIATLDSPQNDGEKAEDMLEVVREFLLEKTSQFYNDIIDAQGEKAGMDIGHLRKRYEALQTQIANVLCRYPVAGIEDELNSRLKSIDAALRQLSVRSPLSTALSLSSSDSGRSSTDELGNASHTNPLYHWRRWIESIDERIDNVQQAVDWTDSTQLEQLLKQQQALQRQIQNQGGQWLNIVQKHVDSWPSSHRRQIVLDSIKRRWYKLWIKSVEWQCRLERELHELLMGVTKLSDADSDLDEPSVKRIRLCGPDVELFNDKGQNDDGIQPVDDSGLDDICSGASDTIPFSESEYEPFTPRSLPPNSPRCDYEEVNSARDGGYSSGSSVVVRCEDVAEEIKTADMDFMDERFFPLIASSPVSNIPVSNPRKYPHTTIPPSMNDPPDPACFVDRFGQTRKLSVPRVPDNCLPTYPRAYVAQPPELTDSLLVNVGDTISEAFDNSNIGNSVDDFDEILDRLGEEQEADTFEAELEGLLLRRQGASLTPVARQEKVDNDYRELTPTPIVETPPNTPISTTPTGRLSPMTSTGCLKRRRGTYSQRATSDSQPLLANSGTPVIDQMEDQKSLAQSKNDVKVVARRRIIIKSKAKKRPEIKNPVSVRRLLFRYWPVQLCLLGLLVLNVVLFYPDCCDNVNQYFWSYGLKTEYTNGPPPT